MNLFCLSVLSAGDEWDTSLHLHHPVLWLKKVKFMQKYKLLNILCIVSIVLQ